MRRGDGDARGTASTRAALTYYDLGSGAGKSVLTAALSPYFARCRGIELLPCVHAIAEILVEDFSRDVAPRDDGVSPSVSVSLGDIFVDLSWIDADFVFCNCVTWDEATMARLASHAAEDATRCVVRHRAVSAAERRVRSRRRGRDRFQLGARRRHRPPQDVAHLLVLF